MTGSRDLRGLGLPWDSPQAMYDEVDPWIRTEVRVFLRTRRRQQVDVESESDLVNSIWVALLKDEYAELRRWDSSKGSMRHFIGLKTKSKLKDQQRKSVGRAKIAPHTALEEDPRRERNTPEDFALNADLVTKVDRCVRLKLGKRELHIALYDLEFIQGLDDPTVEATLKIDHAKHYRMRHVISGIRKDCWKAATEQR